MYPSTNHVTYRIHEPVELHCGECTSLNKRQVRSNAAIHTATPAINGGKRRHSAALSELGAPFLNGVHRSVNRKVQGSNPWSGAKSELVSCSSGPRQALT